MNISLFILIVIIYEKEYNEYLLIHEQFVIIYEYNDYVIIYNQYLIIFDYICSIIMCCN